MASSSASISAAKALTSTKYKVAIISLKEAQEKYQKEREEQAAARALAAAASSSPVASLSVSTADSADLPELYPSFLVPAEHSMPASELAKQLLDLNRGGTKVLLPGPALALPFARSKTFTFSYLNILHRADTTVYRRGLNAAPAIRQEIRRALLPTVAMVRCNGSLRGQLSRLSDRMVAPPASYKPVFPPTLLVAQRQRFSAEDITMVEAKFGRDSVLGPLNEDSYVLHNLVNGVDAGMPYALEASGKQVCPKTDGLTFLPVKYWHDQMPKANRAPTILEKEPRLIHEHSFQLAKWLYHNILDNDPVEFLAKLEELKKVAPELFTGMAKRKDERIARDEFLTKVRTYSVMPNPVKLLLRWALEPYKMALRNYYEDEASNSALGVSPFFGMAEYDGKWVLKRAAKVRATKQKCGGWGKHYSDDKKLYILFPSGELVVWAPDIKSMDLSTTNRVVPMVTELVLRSGLAIGLPFSQPRANAISWWASMCFRSYLHVGGSAVLEKLHSLMSGIPGTTEMNDIVSEIVDVTIERVIDRFFEKNPNATAVDMPRLAKLIADAVFATYLYEFKDVSFAEDGAYTGGCKWAVFASPEDYETKDDLIPFLGMVRVHFKERVLFVPADLSALVAGLVLPKNGQKPSDKLVERIRGVFLTGGWFQPAFNQFLRKMYDDVYDQQTYKEGVDAPYDTDEVCHGEDDVDFLTSEFLIGGNALPSDEVMLDFCTLTREKFASKYHGQKLAHATEKLAPAASSSSSSVSADDYDPLRESVLAAIALTKKGPTFKASGVGHGNSTSSADQEAYAAKKAAGIRRRAAAHTVRLARQAGEQRMLEYRRMKGRGPVKEGEELDAQEQEIQDTIDAIEARADAEVMEHLKNYEEEDEYQRSLEDQYGAVDDDDLTDAKKREATAWERWQARDEQVIKM